MINLKKTLNLPLFNEQGDQIDYTLYDRMALDNGSGPTEREFFVNGLGSEDPITGLRKTKADTNVREGKIPEGQAFAAFALKFWIETDEVRTEAERVLFNNWIKGCVVEILIESKNQYGTWKLSEIFGRVDDSQVTAGANGQAFEVSRGDYSGVKKFNLYIPLPRLVTYSVKLIQTVAPAAALDGDFIACGLVGILNRAG